MLIGEPETQDFFFFVQKNQNKGGKSVSYFFNIILVTLNLLCTKECVKGENSFWLTGEVDCSIETNNKARQVNLINPCPAEPWCALPLQTV